MFFKIGVLKNFTNFIGKHLCWSLFLKNHYRADSATKEKIGERTHALGCRMPVALTKVHKLNHKGNLDWLKRCFDNFL